ncbi:MAG: trigger factor [Aquisalimonadaceae bacterium]
MQVSVETTEGLERRMVVQVPASRLDGEVQSRLQNLARTVRMDGFRPGKVPAKVVEKRYGAQVHQEVLNEVLQQTYSEALQQENLNPAGAPSVDVRQGMTGGDLEYEAVFEIMPEIEVKGHSEMALKRPVADISDADIDRVLTDLRKQQATYRTVDREATDNDRVIVDFHGKVNGEGFPGSEGEDQPVTIGSGTMPPEFESALKGLKQGDSRDIEYAFGDDFPTSEVAGKTAIFHTTVKAVEEPELPEFDDTFAESVGVKEGGIQALRDLVRKNLEAESGRAVRARLKEQVTEVLARENEITLPKALVDGEIQALQQQMKQRIQSQTGQDDGLDLPGELFEEQARRRVTLGLVMNRLIADNSIKLDQNRVKQQLFEMAAGYEKPDEIIQYYSQNRQLMQSLEVSVLEDQVIDWIVEQAKVEDEPIELQALLNPQSTKPEGAAADQAEKTEG